MNKNINIMKLVLPAIIAGIGLTNTGCVATRCYETRPVTRMEVTYVTPPKHHVAPPRKPAPRPQAKPLAKAKPMPQAKPVAKAKTARPHQQAKVAPRQKPTAKPKKRI